MHVIMTYLGRGQVKLELICIYKIDTKESQEDTPTSLPRKINFNYGGVRYTL